MGMDNEIIQVLLWDTAAVVAVIYASTFFISRINYQIDDRYVRMRVGRLRIRKIPIDDISDVTVGYRHWVESWTKTINPWTIAKKAVTIYRKTGVFKRVVITPDDPPGFVRKIKDNPRYNPRHDSPYNPR